MSQAISLTKDDLKEIVAAAVSSAIEESRKPLPPTEKQLQEIEMQQRAREQNAAGVIAAMENKRATQRICAHEHNKRDGGGTHCVWVREEDHRSHGYIYCQKCEARVRPGTYDANGLPHQRDRVAIYDTDLFNRLFQQCGSLAIGG